MSWPYFGQINEDRLALPFGNMLPITGPAANTGYLRGRRDTSRRFRARQLLLDFY